MGLLAVVRDQNGQFTGVEIAELSEEAG